MSPVISKLELGKWLKAAREKAGYTQWDVAKCLVYTTPQFISNVERGVSIPSWEQLNFCCQLYDITNAQLMKVLERLYHEGLRRTLDELTAEEQGKTK